MNEPPTQRWSNSARLSIAAAALALAAVIPAGLKFIGSQSTASKLESSLGADSCTKAGVIAIAGGRSTFYRCTITTVNGAGFETTKAQCAVWIDGSAYDVTQNARASARLSGEPAPC